MSDPFRLEVHTHFTGTPSERHVFAVEDIARADVQQRLRTLWTDADGWWPKRSNREITEEAARTFAAKAERRRAVGVAPERVSHFLTQCVFSFFAEDVGLLPVRLFERLVGARVAPEALRAQFAKLFETMRGLDPAKRSQLGAHYTDPATIMRLVEPVVARPLRPAAAATFSIWR